MKRVTKYLFTILSFSIIFSSCDLEAIVENINNTIKLPEAAGKLNSNLEVQTRVMDIFEQLNELSIVNNNQGSPHYGNQHLPQVNWLTDKHLVLDYTNVAHSSGKIDVLFNEVPSLTTEFLKAYLSFENFILDSTALIGEMNLELVTIGLPTVFSLRTSGYLIVSHGDENFEWSASQSIEWISGLINMQGQSDNKFKISGVSKIKDGGVVNEFKIVSPLLYDNSCQYLPEGVIHLESNIGTTDEFLTILDFGVGAEGSNTYGECDGFVEAIIGVDPLIFDLSEY